MSVLTLTPKSWGSWNFAVSDGERQLADVRLSWWREKGMLSLEDGDYDVYRESLLGDFVLERAGSIVARASKPSVFERCFVISYHEKSYTLRARAALRRAFVVMDGSLEVGSIVPESIWTRRATVQLPDEWPLAVQSFAMWLTIVHWKRDAS